MTARAAILTRIREATADVRADEPPAWDVEREGSPASAYLRAIADPPLDVAARFVSRMREHEARAVEVLDRPGAISSAVSEAAGRYGVSSAIVPTDLPEEWTPPGIRRIADAPAFDPVFLSTTECVITGAALAIAETGTIVLDGGAAQGRRALTLVPDVHLCVVRESQVVRTVPEAIRRLAPSARERHQITLISGPSATSDIAFERVVGVHGPRRLEVIFVRDVRAADSPERDG